MLNTGIRRSELLGLKWSDINFERRVMHIERAVTQTKGEIIVDKPKTKTSVRTIPLSAAFTEYLQQFAGQTDCFVIGNNKNPFSASTYSKQFRKFMCKMSDEIGLVPLSPHELRHTYGTILRESGVDIYTIQKVMGHSDISVTAAIYVHNDLEVLRRQMKFDDEE